MMEATFVKLLYWKCHFNLLSVTSVLGPPQDVLGLYTDWMFFYTVHCFSTLYTGCFSPALSIQLKVANAMRSAWQENLGTEKCQATSQMFFPSGDISNLLLTGEYLIGLELGRSGFNAIISQAVQ